jgi:hypothetical protein
LNASARNFRKSIDEGMKDVGDPIGGLRWPTGFYIFLKGGPPPGRVLSGACMNTIFN